MRNRPALQKMKAKFLGIMIVLILVQTTVTSDTYAQSEKTAIIYDSYHSWVGSHYYSQFFSALSESFSVKYSEGRINEKELSSCSILMISAPTKTFSTSEISAIKKFINEGGGLLLGGVGWFWVDEYQKPIENFPFNQIGKEFGVMINDDSVIDPTNKKSGKYPIFRNFAEHPVTEGLVEICSGYPSSLSVTGNAHSIVMGDEDSYSGYYYSNPYQEGDCPPIVAALEQGYGRIIFMGQDAFFSDVWIGSYDNLKFGINTFNWLSESGGPIRKYKLINEQAQQKLSEAKSLYQNHHFSQAISSFEEATSLFEESNKVYRNTEADQGIQEARQYIEKCSTGAEAEGILDTAKGLYDKREYEKAIEKFENAQSLFQVIEYTKKAEECITMIEESNEWILLREKAMQELSDAESALKTAPSTYDPTGYENAKALFVKAKSTWEVYDDQEKVALCQEKIELCNDEIAVIEKNKLKVVIGVIVIIVGVVIVIVIIIVRKHKSRPVPEDLKLEQMTKNLDEMVEKGLITEKEYNLAKKEIQEQSKKKRRRQ